MTYQYDDNDNECELKITISNDGIGLYEFWGQRCFDKGNPTVEFELEGVYIPDGLLRSGLLFDEVSALLESQNHIDRITEQALEHQAD